MKFRRFFFPCLLLLLSLLAGQRPLQAQTTADLAGSWHGYSFSTPSYLDLIFNGQGLVTDIPQVLSFDYHPNNITVAADGSFTGNKSGTITIPNAGVVVTSIPGDNESTTFHVTRSNDFMIAVNNSGGDNQDLIFLLKAPANVTAADVAGNWNIVTFQTPTNIILNRADSGKPGVVTSISAGNQFSIGTGNLSINGANGNVSGALEEPFTGQVQNYDSVNGQLNLTITPSGSSGFTIPLYINASKDVMIAAQSELATAGNFQEILIFVRAPATIPALGNLKGLWRLTTFDTPSILTEVTDGNGHLTELNNRDAFSANSTQTLVTGSDGFFTGHFELPAIGSFTLPNAGQIAADFTESDNSTGSGTFFLNAGLNFFMAVQSNSYNQEITFATRGPVSTSNTRNLGLLFFQSKVYWAADTTRKLQSLGDLNTTSWTDVPSTQGTHLFTPTTGSGNQFYRVVDVPAP